MDVQGDLQREIRQTRPFRSTSQEAVLGLFRTTDMVRRWFAQRLERRGLTLQQYNVLRILRGAGAEGLPTLAIGERVIERTPGITRLIDRLEKKGLVSRCRAEGDRRCVICQLTPAGSELLAELDPVMAEADDRSLDMLEPADQRRLVELLDTIRRGYADRGV